MKCSDSATHIIKIWLLQTGITYPHIFTFLCMTGPIKKVVWTLVFLTLFGVAINTLREIISVFIDRPVDVVTKLERRSDIPFPAVTLCNLNPTRNSMLVGNPALKDALNTDDEKIKRQVKRDTDDDDGEEDDDIEDDELDGNDVNDGQLRNHRHSQRSE